MHYSAKTWPYFIHSPFSYTLLHHLLFSPYEYSQFPRILVQKVWELSACARCKSAGMRCWSKPDSWLYKTHTCSGSAVAHIVKSIFRKPNLGSLKLDVLQNLTKKYNSTYFRFSGIFQQNFGERNPDLAIHSWLTHSILIPPVWAKAAACNSCPGAVVILINTHSSWV